MSALDGLCSCKGGMPNFGEGNCPDELDAPFILVISQVEDSSGNAIGIDYTQTLDTTFMNGKLHNENADDRMIVITNIKGYTPEQADNKTDEAPNGDIDNLQDGITSVEFEFRPHNISVDARSWKSMACLQLQANIVDLSGNWTGKKGSGTTIIGKKIAINSLSVRPKPRTFGESAKLIIKFNYTLDSGEETTQFLKPSDFTDYDLLTDVKPLRSVYCTITGTSTTTVNFQLALAHGSIKDPSIDGVTGLTTADLEMRNQTDEADVTFSGLIEPSTPDGSYEGTFALQDATDVVNIQPILNVKTPLSLNTIITETATI